MFDGFYLGFGIWDWLGWDFVLKWTIVARGAGRMSKCQTIEEGRVTTSRRGECLVLSYKHPLHFFLNWRAP